MTDDETDTDPLAEEIDEEMPDRPSVADHDSTLAGIADELRGGFVKITVAVLLAVSRIVPFSERFWRGLYRAGLIGIWKKSGCDYLGMVQVGGEIKPVPVDWDHDAQRFENRHGDWWKAPSEGEYQYRMAQKVPAIWASATSNHVGSHIQAEVAEALDLGHDLNLYESATVQVQNATLSGGSQGKAVADGGQQLTSFQVDGVRPGPFKDQVVPLTSADEYDARAVSMEKYYETYPEVTDTEEMKMQEKRGELAHHDRDYGRMALKMLLVAGAIIAAVELGPPIINAMFGGGGGGGGGGIIPITMGLI